MSATNHWASALIWLMGIWWWLEETTYFGWNAFPHSVIVIYALAALTYVLEKRSAMHVKIIVENTHD